MHTKTDIVVLSFIERQPTKSRLRMPPNFCLDLHMHLRRLAQECHFTCKLSIQVKDFRKGANAVLKLLAESEAKEIKQMCFFLAIDGLQKLRRGVRS
jgi:hypothetical protein